MELSKHFLMKGIAKSIIVIVLLLAVFLFIIGSLTADNTLRTDNPVIRTGAVISESIAENPFVDETVEKIGDFFKNLIK